MGNKKGRLKIFFGYVAGAGKTYAMLEAAHVAQKKGIDVIIGYVEAHQRPETTALVTGLEEVEPIWIDYRGIKVKELDLDAILKRNPELVLIDELAHTNTEGMRHRKRYQDVDELLEAGIDVYTTVNVQHIESLNDLIALLTKVSVKERIPDYVFNEADQVKFVDIEPDDLIQRLNEGKVYQLEQVQKALNHFFKRENLIALREIALKLMVDRLNQIQNHDHVSHARPSDEHILVCITSAPTNSVVIRSAARMSQAFMAPLTAVYVETPDREDFNGQYEKQLHENAKLAKELGARIVALYGENQAEQVAEYAKMSGVTKIIVGRSNDRRALFKTKRFVDHLMELVDQTEVYIVPSLDGEKRPKLFQRFIFSSKDLAKSSIIIFVVTMIGWIMQSFGMSNINMITLYLLAIQAIALMTSHFVYSFVASMISLLLFDWMFVVPYYSLTIQDPNYISIIIGMWLVSIITSTLIGRIRRQAKNEAKRAYRVDLLFRTSKKLGLSESLDEIARHSMEVLNKLFDCGIVFYTYENGLIPHLFQIDDASIYLKPEEQAVAAWVYQNRKPAGKNTSSLPGAHAYYVPVQSRDKSLAVIGIVLKPGQTVTPFEQTLTKSLLGEISLAIEKFNLMQSAAKADNERLRADLLRSISHDIRTPLTSIVGYAQLLKQQYQNDSLDAIEDEASWLLQLVENLLSLTKIEDEHIKLNTQIELIDDLIYEAVKHSHKQMPNKMISLHLDPQSLLVDVDGQLVVQVLVNLITNAIKYTPESSPIEITTKYIDGRVQVEVKDEGDGISGKKLEHLFEKFYAITDHQDRQRGLGLGLYLCQEIMKEHHSEIYYRHNQPQGAIFGFYLDVKEGFNESTNTHR